MKIVKEGRIPMVEKEFKCSYCGCFFIATKDEYRAANQIAYMHDGITAYCYCPTCGKVAYSSK